MARQKRGRRWYLLYRFEDYQHVWIYEPLQKGELNSRKRKGWKVI